MKEHNNEQDESTTTRDLWLASYAYSQGFEIIGLQEWGDRKLFIFRDCEAFQAMKRDFYWHRAIVDPLAMKKAIRKMKTLSMGGEDHAY